MEIEVAEHRFLARDGLSLVRYRWAPAAPTRSIAIVHGLAEHSERYAPLARWLAGRGSAVHAFDQRGHGASGGPRNHAPSFSLLLDDVEQFLGEVRSEERPIVLIGHSMGGLEVARLLEECGPDVAGAVLSGPALLGPPGSGTKAALARALSTIVPRLPIPNPVDPTGLSRDPEVVRAYRRDPRIHARITARLADELFRAMPPAIDEAERISVPVLVLHGEADPICPVEGSRRFFSRLRAPDCELRAFPGMLHEIFNEIGRETVYEEMHEWICSRAPQGAAQGARGTVQGSGA